MIDKRISQEIAEWFRHHDLPTQQKRSVDRLRIKATELALLMAESCQPSADRTAALRKLREVMWTINAAIALQPRCPACNAEGYVLRNEADPNEGYTPCVACKGTGQHVVDVDKS